MAYRRYSTNNANYAQAYCIHDIATYEEIFSDENIKKFDAIVLESGEMIYPPQVINTHQYSKIANSLIQNNQNAKVYITDVYLSSKLKEDWIDELSEILCGIGFLVVVGSYVANRTKKISRRSFLGWSLGSVAAIAAINVSSYSSIYLGSINGEAWPILPKIVEMKYRLANSRVVTMRDAINAKKIEEFVAPKLKEELQRKPNIALVYGTAHAGLETCLEDKQLRDELLENFKNDGGYQLTLPSQLDVVVEMTYNSKDWNFEIYEAGLF